MIRQGVLAAASVVAVGCASPSGPTAPLSPEGQLLVNTAGDQVAVADVNTGAISHATGLGGTTARYLGGIGIIAHGGGTTIQRRNVATGVLTTLYTAPAGQTVSAVAPSPDGSRIAFVTLNAFGDGKATIQVLSVATGAVVSAGSGRFESLVDLRWFPDGQRLIAQTYDGANAELVRIDLRGSTVTADTVVGGRSRLPGGFALSPDGRRLVLARWTSGGASTGDHFDLVELELGSSGPATELGAEGVQPVFGPTGGWVAFTTRDDRSLRLLRVSDRSVSRLPGAIGTATGTLPLDWR